jgi:hypothetical protein
MTTSPATAAAILDRHYSVGAYWGARAADPTTCGAQVLRFLSSLTDLEPSLDEWRREDGTVESAALPDSPEDLGAQMLARTRENEVGGGISAYFVADGIAVSVRLGMTGQHLGNAVVLRPGRQPKPFWLTQAPMLMTTLIDVFDPEWAVLGPYALRKAQKDMPEPYIGAVTYLHCELETPDVPPNAHLSQHGSGMIIDLTTGGQRLPAISEVLEVRAAVLGSAEQG